MRYAAMLFASVAFLCTAISGAGAEQIGRLLGFTDDVIRDPNSGLFLLLPNLPILSKPIEKAKVRIAIVDSGIASEHPQLRGRVIAQVDFTGEGPEDYVGHGTIVALLAASGPQEIAATGSNSIGLINVKVADRNGLIIKESLIRAIAWIGSESIKVANLSLGFQGSREEHGDLCTAIAMQPNVLFVVAAGNSGPDIPSFPAACEADNVLSVGAVDASGKPTAYSGTADIYAPSETRLLPESHIHYERGKELAKKSRFDQALAAFDKALGLEPLPEAHFQRGVIFFYRRNIEAAKREFSLAVRMNPDFPEALEHLGLALHFENDNSKAIEYLRRAVELAPQQPRPLVNLAVVLAASGHFSEALSKLSEARKLAPDYPGLDEKQKAIRDEMTASKLK